MPLFHLDVNSISTVSETAMYATLSHNYTHTLLHTSSQEIYNCNRLQLLQTLVGAFSWIILFSSFLLDRFYQETSSIYSLIFFTELGLEWEPELWTRAICCKYTVYTDYINDVVCVMILCDIVCNDYYNDDDVMLVLMRTLIIQPHDTENTHSWISSFWFSSKISKMCRNYFGCFRKTLPLYPVYTLL